MLKRIFFHLFEVIIYLAICILTSTFYTKREFLASINFVFTHFNMVYIVNLIIKLNLNTR